MHDILPIAQGVSGKIGLVINLRAANALSITVSPSLLLRADELLE